jgi:PAS domain S-box-containing protein
VTQPDASLQTEELERLTGRVKKLAEDKAYFQLILRLMELLNPLPGLEDMLRGMLLHIVECIGGTNIKLYYWIGEELHYLDFLGESRRLPAIDDETVAQVAKTHVFVERQGGPEEALLRHGVLPGSWTWTFPLLVGEELVGVIKLENVHIHGVSLGRYLPIFFSHAALILSNEVRNTIHRRSEVALQSATERLRLATEAGLIGIWDWDVVADELIWDTAMYRLYGRREGDFGGAYEAWFDAVHPDDKAFADGEIQAALRGEREYAPEFRVVWPDGSVHYLKAASRTIRDESGKPLRMVGINYDLTERKQAEEMQRRLNRELRAISDCNQALMRAEDEQTLLKDICHIICDEAGYRVAWVGYAEHDEAKSIRPVAAAGADEGYFADAGLTWADTEYGRGPAGTAIRLGKVIHVQDFATDARMAPWRERALARGYRSGVALPLKDDQSKAFGVLLIYAAAAKSIRPEELRLLEELAGDLAFGITTLRARTELKSAEQARLAHVHFLESLDRVNRAIQGAIDIKQMMTDVLDVVLPIFACDRAFLLFPCDPDAAAWRVPMERTKPEYPGVLALGHEVPTDPDVAETFRLLMAADGPVRFGPGTPHPLPAEVSARYGFKCLMSMAIRPKAGRAWQFGLHQCSHVRAWTSEEERLFLEIGRRLGDALTSLLMQAELRENEHRLAEAERIVHVGYWDRDLQDNRISLSDETYRIFGLSPGQRIENLAQWHELWGRLIHPDDQARIIEAVSEALRGGAPYDVEYRIVQPCGEVRVVHSRGDVTWDAEERPQRMFGTMQDITERKQAEQELERHRRHLEELVAARTRELAEARDAAESANRMKSVFLANMSHELRTPLNAILGFAQIMERDQRIPEDERGNLRTISRSGHHLLALINDVLEISRIEAGRLTLQPSAFDLLDMLTGLRELVELRAREKGLTLRMVLSPTLPRFVRADAGKLRQVLLNLLTNAVKYTEAGEIELAAAETGAGPSPRLRFTVRDTGVGIAAPDLENIFQPFFQADYGAALGEGTGLGLAISREYAHLLGGSLQVDSEFHCGSTFRLEVPVEATGSPVVAGPTHGQVVGLASGQPAFRVLVVEDDPDSCYLLVEILKQVDFQVHTAANGEEAVAAFQAWHPDFIWMDMRMPVMDGYEATRRIRRLPGGREVKIAALTASAFREDREEIFAAGCDQVLAKPLDEDQLFATMESLLGLRYRYADAPVVTQTSVATELSGLPPVLREELARAAQLLDVEAAERAIGRIREIDARLGGELADLAQAYRYDRIISLCNGP